MESIHIPRFHTDPTTRLSVLHSHLTPTTRRQYSGISGIALYVSSSLRKNQQALNTNGGTLKETVVPRRDMVVVMMSSLVLSHFDSSLSGNNQVMAVTPTAGLFKEYMDTFDGYSFFYPKNWVQVRGSGADVFFRDSFVLDENLSVEISSPSSSDYKSVEDLGLPENAGERVQKQNLIEFMSTRLGVRRESNILSTSSRVADDGKLYYDVEVNVKSYANNNELAVMPQERITSLEWDRRYLSVLGVENKRLYELRLQIPESVFVREEANLRSVMDSFRVFKTMG